MKAVSVKQPWAWMLVAGFKTIETRTWATKYRGELLIVASKTVVKSAMDMFGFEADDPRLLKGMAVGIVDLVDCKPMVQADVKAARCPVYDKAHSWFVKHARQIEPFAVKGQLGLYDVECGGDIDYAYQERLAILELNNPDMHVAYAKNKAAKEIRERENR